MGQPASDPKAEAELAAMQRATEADKNAAIKDRVSRDTRDLALQFGTSSSFTGASVTPSQGGVSKFLRFMGGGR